MFRYRVNKDPLSSCRLKIAKFLCQNGTFLLVFSAAADGNFCLEVCSCQSGKILSTKRMTGADILTVTTLKQDGGSSCQKITTILHSISQDQNKDYP